MKKFELANVRNLLVTVRNEPMLLDRDVAELYGVQTKEINQAVRNNPEKFPEGYVFSLSKDECDDLRSKFLTANISSKSRVLPRVFSEKGLYMLATILKGEKAVRATLSIIETFAQVRSLKRELLELHKEGDKKKKHALMQHFGETLTDIVMPDPDEVETESSLELNFFIGKIKHTVRKIKKNR